MSLPLEAVSGALPEPPAQASAAPVVIVGNGPVGMHAARELLRRDPATRLVVYGEEPYLPYHRVRLSGFLAGKVDWQGLMDTPEDSLLARAELRFGVRVVAIDPESGAIEEEGGSLQRYRALILATGSRPHVPHLPGMDLPGIYTFRDLDDAQHLLARQVRSRYTVVLGGGLLGIEAARAMQRGHTRVTLVEHADRLLGQQLDEAASRLLESRLETLGIHCIVGDGVRRIHGREAVEFLELNSGTRIPCDTLIVATGIRPRIELARAAGLSVGRGIRVDDRMRTSVNGIYAVGECAEHRERVHGLVAPGLEQAAVAASDIAGYPARYTGSIVASRLKVADCPVFSSGPVGARDHAGLARSLSFADSGSAIYRRILLRRGRLIGAVAVGEWKEASRIQQAIADKQWIWPWQQLRFRLTGRLWPETQADSVTHWPASATVCQCTGVSRGRIDDAIREGADSPEAVTGCTGAGSVCGSCRPLVVELLGQKVMPPAPWSGTLLTGGLLALVLTTAYLLFPPLPYPDSVQTQWRWDLLWRDGLARQITGFTVLGLFLLGLSISPRKRIACLRSLGRFDAWRLLHLVTGVLVILILFLHTGGRIGAGLNAWLLLAFSATLLAGGITSGLIALEHRLAARGNRLRRQFLWWHILAFWPVPVLLAFHVLAGYWY